jgi:hypothetical protein
MELKVKDTSFLTGDNGLELSTAEADDFDQQLPQQVEKDKAEALGDTTDTAASSTTSSLASSAVVNFLIAGSLNFVWGLIGSLQNIAFMAALNVKLPGNSQNFVYAIFDIANFDIMPE